MIIIDAKGAALLRCYPNVSLSHDLEPTSLER